MPRYLRPRLWVKPLHVVMLVTAGPDGVFVPRGQRGRGRRGSARVTRSAVAGQPAPRLTRSGRGGGSGSGAGTYGAAIVADT